MNENNKSDYKNELNNYLKLGETIFYLETEDDWPESYIKIYTENEKITKCDIFCQFAENIYNEIPVAPQVEMNNIQITGNKIEELTGNLFKKEAKDSYISGNFFHLNEHTEHFINYEIKIIEINNDTARILINGVAITDGNSTPYKTDTFIIDVIIPIVFYESKKVVSTEKVITYHNSEEKYVNLVMFTLFGLIGGGYVLWSFYQFIISFITIFILLLTVFCWYKVFKIYGEIKMNKCYLKRNTLINIISKKDYNDYDKLLLLKKEIEKYKYYYDKRFMPKLKNNIQWRQDFLKEEAKNHIKDGDISFAYKNLFELISAENPVLHGSNIHITHFYGADKKEHEKYYKDGFICEKEKNIITEMINDIEKAANNKNETPKDENIISNVLDNLKYIKKYDQYNGTVYINFLKKSCDLVICGNNIEYAEKCINYLNKDMPVKVFNNIFESLLKYCYYYLDNYDDINIPRDLNASDILQYISDISIIISEPKLNTIGFVIVGNCEWEEEHGFCVVVENEKVKYVGEHDNNFDPWGNNYDAGFAK